MRVLLIALLAAISYAQTALIKWKDKNGHISNGDEFHLANTSEGAEVGFMKDHYISIYIVGVFVIAYSIAKYISSRRRDLMLERALQMKELDEQKQRVQQLKAECEYLDQIEKAKEESAAMKQRRQRDAALRPRQPDISMNAYATEDTGGKIRINDSDISSRLAPTPASMNAPLPMEVGNPIWHVDHEKRGAGAGMQMFHVSIKVKESDKDEDIVSNFRDSRHMEAGNIIMSQSEIRYKDPIYKRFPLTKKVRPVDNWTLRSKFDEVDAVFNNENITKLILTDMMHLEIFPHENDLKTYLCKNQELRFSRKQNSDKMLMRHVAYDGDEMNWKVSMRDMDMYSENCSFEVCRLKWISDGNHSLLAKVKERIYVNYSEDQSEYGGSLDLLFADEQYSDIGGRMAIE